ncbi:Uncharacterized protein FWK35_00030193, partial [Aphis craccivora]
MMMLSVLRSGDKIEKTVGSCNSLADRQKADYILENRALNRFKSIDSNLKEKAAAWLVTTGMKAKVPRVIPIPKTGGMLPLIPIFAGLSALGALTGGIANVVKTVSEFNRNEPSHLGRGLYLAPNKDVSYKIEKGKVLYLAPYGGGSYKRKGTQFRDSIGKCINLTIPTGSYEIINLESTIQKLLPNYVTLFQLKADGSTLKCSMTCSHIDFTIEHNISKILGFENKVYSANTKHESERIVNIMKVNCIKID